MYFEKLQKFVTGMQIVSCPVTLTIIFEKGASLKTDTIVTIKLESRDERVCPSLAFTGADIEEASLRMINSLLSWYDFPTIPF